MDLMGMLGDMQQKAQDLQKNLKLIEIEAEAGDGAVKIKATADKRIKNISIEPSFLADADAEEVEDLLLVALNRVLEKADAKASAETQNLAGGMLPPGFNLPGM